MKILLAYYSKRREDKWKGTPAESFPTFDLMWWSFGPLEDSERMKEEITIEHRVNVKGTSFEKAFPYPTFHEIDWYPDFNI